MLSDPSPATNSRTDDREGDRLVAEAFRSYARGRGGSGGYGHAGRVGNDGAALPVDRPVAAPTPAPMTAATLEPAPASRAAQGEAAGRRDDQGDDDEDARDERQAPGGRVARKSLTVPLWCVRLTPNGAQALLLAFFRYWLEPKGNATGPRTRFADGRYHWVGSRYDDLAYSTGLPIRTVRAAVPEMIKSGLLVRRTEEDETARGSWPLHSGQEQPIDGCAGSYYRLAPNAVYARLVAYLRAEGLDAAILPRIEGFSGAIPASLRHHESDDWGGWYRSEVQTLLDENEWLLDPETVGRSATDAAVRHWVSVSPAVVRGMGGGRAAAEDAIVLSKLAGWMAVARRSGKTYLTRTRAQIAAETGVIPQAGANRGDHHRVERCLERLTKAGWLTKTVRKVGVTKSVLVLRLTPRADEMLRKAKATRRPRRGAAEGPDGDQVDPAGPRRVPGRSDAARRGRPVPRFDRTDGQTPAETNCFGDGRVIDPETGEPFWDGRVYDEDAGQYLDPRCGPDGGPVYPAER